MSWLHFAGETGAAKCQHVQARSRSDLTDYFAYNLKRGENHGYDLDAIRSGYADWSGKSKSAAKEASQLLRNFNLIGSDNRLTSEGEVVGKAYSDGRANTVKELFKQHFRCFPTLAYTLDILWQADDPLNHEETYDRVLRYATSDSTIRANSIRNGLNLLDDFDAVKKIDDKWVINRVDQPIIESTAYGLLLLSRNQEVIDSDSLRGRLPRLLLSETAGTERVLHEIRGSVNPFNIRTTGDSSRTTPFAGIYEIDIRNTSAKDIQGEYF